MKLAIERSQGVATVLRKTQAQHAEEDQIVRSCDAPPNQPLLV